MSLVKGQMRFWVRGHDVKVKGHLARIRGHYM